MHKKIFNLITASIFTGIILLLSLVKNLGYIQIGAVSITIIHIPVILGAMILPLFYGMWLGFVFGLGSLVASFIYAGSPIDLLFQNPAVSILPRVVFAESIAIVKYLVSKTKNNKVINNILLFTTTIFIAIFVILIPNRLRLVYSDNLAIWLFNIVQIGLLLIGSTMIILLLINGLFKSKNSLIRTSIIPITSTIIHTFLVISLILIFSNNVLLNAEIKRVLSVSIILNASVETFLALLIIPPIYLEIKNFLNRGKYDITF